MAGNTCPITMACTMISVAVYKLPKKPHLLTWWIDAQFLPYSDNTLVTSVGAYVYRGPVQTPVIITHLVQGLIYTISFTKQTCM